MEKIKRELASGDISSIDAIQKLERLGFSPKSAEYTVHSWERGQSSQSSGLSNACEQDEGA
jgi:hypothetical protein